MPNQYVACWECDDKQHCGLALPSRPGFGCLAGVKNGESPVVIEATLCYQDGNNYHVVIDGTVKQIMKIVNVMPFMDLNDGKLYPTWALPKVV